jgi:hypothetical protein
MPGAGQEAQDFTVGMHKNIIQNALFNILHKRQLFGDRVQSEPLKRPPALR